jgi:acetyl-CoA C-acetyltransferase
MEKAYIVSGIRSYIGIENGMYRHIPAEKLGAAVLKEAIKPYRTEDIDLILGGNAVGGGGNMTRLMMLEAGVDVSVPAVTVDLQCGSGLESIAIAAAKIKSGQADMIVAGGFESSSTAPLKRYHKNHPDYERYGAEDSFYHVAKFTPGEHRMTVMLESAEKTACSLGMSREALDKWVLSSHQKAKAAREEGILEDILVSVENGLPKDEGIRDNMSERLLKRLPCVLKNGTKITAANACLTNDGAAFLVLCSQKYLDKMGYTPKAEVIDSVQAGCDPSMSPKSANQAIRKLLLKHGLTAGEIDIFECNEAFSVIDELFVRQYPEAEDRYNILGGALAYGHPYGASGGIITLHALKALEKVNGKLAVCAVAAAGGVGSAMLLKKA